MTATMGLRPNSFRQQLSKVLATQESTFHSCYSIEVALAMTAAGAEGETRDAMADALGLPRDRREMNAVMATRVAEVNEGQARPYELVTANALWAQKGYQFKTDYVKDVELCYGGKFETVDYQKAPDEAVKTINAWVEQQTRDKIKDLVPRAAVDSDTRLILTNAIYFKGKWKTEFNKKTTNENGKFHGTKGDRTVPLMYLTDDIRYYEDEQVQAVDLPYQGDELSMLVVLPQPDADDLDTFDTEDFYQKVIGNLYTERELRLYLPRFKLETSYKLKDALCRLGMEIAFTDQADFGGIGDKDLLKISEVIHKAFVEVNEEGTEAAAATAVVMKCCSVSLDERIPKTFRADRPFLFYIRNSKTDTVLFEGSYQ